MSCCFFESENGNVMSHFAQILSRGFHKITKLNLPLTTTTKYSVQEK